MSKRRKEKDLPRNPHCLNGKHRHAGHHSTSSYIRDKNTNLLDDYLEEIETQEQENNND